MTDKTRDRTRCVACGARTMELIGAERLADAVDAAIRARAFDTRSPIADALLDYREPAARLPIREGDAPPGEGLDELIRALTILRRYGNPRRPTYCEHDELMICNIDPDAVSGEEIEELDALGFFRTDDGGFKSFRYGSA